MSRSCLKCQKYVNVIMRYTNDIISSSSIGIISIISIINIISSLASLFQNKDWHGLFCEPT